MQFAQENRDLIAMLVVCLFLFHVWPRLNKGWSSDRVTGYHDGVKTVIWAIVGMLLVTLPSLL